MRLTTGFATLAAVAGLATFTPRSAAALDFDLTIDVGADDGCVGTVQLGFGGFFSGCNEGFRFAAFFESATDVSIMHFSFGEPVRDPITNAQGNFNTELFDNDCGADGSDGDGVFCFAGTPDFQDYIGPFNDELVFRLNNTGGVAEGYGAKDTHLYSGDDPSRNDPPAPEGIQNWLWRISGGTYDGMYLLGWEDLNSGCTEAMINAGSIITNETFVVQGGTNLEENFIVCTEESADDESDNDYNDFYVLIDPIGFGDPSETVPEPMTMTLMATGLVGLAAARRRNRKS